MTEEVMTASTKGVPGTKQTCPDLIEAFTCDVEFSAILDVLDAPTYGYTTCPAPCGRCGGASQAASPSPSQAPSAKPKPGPKPAAAAPAAAPSPSPAPKPADRADSTTDG